MRSALRDSGNTTGACLVPRRAICQPPWKLARQRGFGRVVCGLWYFQGVVSFLRKLSLFGLAALLGACATQGPPITKLVGGRQITTRSVDPTAYEHVARALLHEDQEHWQDAVDELQRGILFDEDSPELHAHLAELFLRLGRDKDAATEVRTSLKLGPSASGLLADAHVRRAQGDAAGQVTALRQATKEVDFDAGDDDAESVYLELAEAEVQTLDLPSAQGTLEVLTQAEPASATGQMRLTAVYWAQGAMTKAESALHAALTEEPNQIEALAALAWVYAAVGKNDEARATFREAIDRSEGALEIAAAFARFLVGIGSQKEAEQLADDLGVPDGSLDAESLGGRVELERSARRLDRALALLAHTRELGIAENQKTRISLLQATILKEQGKSDEAVAALVKVGKDSPLFFEARLRAGELLREGGKAAEATRVVEEAATASKGDRDAIEVEAAVSLALIDEKRGDAKSGVARLEKILARHPDEGRAIMILAAIEERRGSWQHALAIIERYLTKNPGSVEALNFWGFVAADHDHALDLAKKRLQAACALDPGSGGLLDSLGWVHFRLNDWAQASLFLEQAARLEPADAEIQWHLGELYAERKDRERAEAAYRRGLGFSPDERVRRKLEDGLAKLGGRKVSGQ
jgi:Tfp pilus assembly protein PilF